jgi:hypothetical protein
VNEAESPVSYAILAVSGVIPIVILYVDGEPPEGQPDIVYVFPISNSELAFGKSIRFEMYSAFPFTVIDSTLFSESKSTVYVTPR